jgi:copper chaperone
MHRFHVPKMSCGGCLRTVSQATQNVDPQAQVEGDLNNRVIIVVSAKAEAPLLTALAEAGYSAQALRQRD